jgi:hypothetical protein
MVCRGGRVKKVGIIVTGNDGGAWNVQVGEGLELGMQSGEEVRIRARV